MGARYIFPLFLFVPACGDADSDGSGDTDTDGSTTSTSAPGTTNQPPPPGSSGEDEEGSETTATSLEGSTSGPGEGSSSSSTGAPPVMTPGCDVEVPPEDGEHTFTLADIERRYVLRLPENYTNEQAWPLIFALHGNGGNPGYWDAVGGDRDIRTAFAQEAIIIIPEAINNAWRDYDADPSTWPAGIELELDFFDTVYETAKNELCIDTENVFSMGFSGGGSFSGVLGCRRDYIRAIAVGGSVVYFEIEDCTETPAAWITIGEMEYTAGREEYLFFFRDHAGCEETSMPGDPKGCVDYDGCGAATPVTYCSHPAGHVWPSIGTDATKAFFQGFYLP